MTYEQTWIIKTNDRNWNHLVSIGANFHHVTIDSRALFLFTRIRKEYGEEQLQYLRVCLSSITILARMSELGGITAQQVMRKRFGVVIAHKALGEGYCVEIVKNGNVVCRLDDDCLASNSLLVTRSVWHSLYTGPLRYAYSQAYSYLPGCSVSAAIEMWNRDEFEREVLPRLNREEGLSRQLQVYNENRSHLDEAQSFLLYDALLRIYCYCREHNIEVQREGLDGYNIVDSEEGLKNRDAECIDVTGDPLGYLGALKVIHPSAQLVSQGDKQYLVKHKPVNLYSPVRGQAHEVVPPRVMDIIKSNAEFEPLPELVVGSGVVDEALKSSLTAAVLGILGRSGNPATPLECEVYEFHKRMTSEGRIGKNSLVGLGSVAGEGPIDDCLHRVYLEVRSRARGVFSDDDCFKMACSKVSNMNSAKTIMAAANGSFLLRDRSCGRAPLIGGLNLH